LTESPVLKAASTVLYYLLPNFSDFNISAWVSHGQPVAGRLVLLNTLYAVLYGGFLVGASAMLFSRKDLK
ncbi:MAG: hypothetical protein HY649_09040, partial [Acidobacteria bacterium]|nr:hypothetical protein [Acidobacteriota bacterium]